MRNKPNKQMFNNSSKANFKNKIIYLSFIKFFHVIFIAKMLLQNFAKISYFSYAMRRCGQENSNP